MKILTLWQPWASLIAVGAKTIETRSWKTDYRGPLAIHAAARPIRPAEVTPEIISALSRAGRETFSEPLRAILAVCELRDCVPAPQAVLGAQTEIPFGDFSDGRWAWLLDDVRPVPSDRTILCKGERGLWTPSPNLLYEIEALPHDR